MVSPRAIICLVFIAALAFGSESATQQANALIAKRDFEAAEVVVNAGLSSAKSSSDQIQLKNLLAICYFNTLRPRDAEETWSGIMGGDNLSQDGGEDAWRNFLVFSVDTGNVILARKLAAMRSRDPISSATLKISALLSGGESSGIAFDVKSAMDLTIGAEWDYLYGSNLIDLSALKISEGVANYRGQKIPIREDEDALLSLFKGDLDRAEVLLRRQVQKTAGSAPQVPRADKALLRLARVYRARKEFYLADVLIRDADSFIVRVYGDKSPLRVWPIDEKARLLLQAENSRDAERLVQSAIVQYPDYRGRLEAAIGKVRALP